MLENSEQGLTTSAKILMFWQIVDSLLRERGKRIARQNMEKQRKEEVRRNELKASWRDRSAMAIPHNRVKREKSKIRCQNNGFVESPTLEWVESMYRFDIVRAGKSVHTVNRWVRRCTNEFESGEHDGLYDIRIQSFTDRFCTTCLDLLVSHADSGKLTDKQLIQQLG